MNNQTAFGGMLQHLVELTSILLRPEPLDTEIERRCKQAWQEAPYPDCGETTVNAGDSSPRLRMWCSHCRYTFTYTRNTPFEGRTLTPGEIIIAFVLYADTLLSINQVVQLFEAVYDTIHTTIREVKDALNAASTLSGQNSKKMVTAPPRLTEPGRSVLGSKDKRRRGTVFAAAATVTRADHAGKVRQAIR